MVLCRACNYFRKGTIGPAWCEYKSKAVHAKDEACNSRVKLYRKRTLKPKVQPLDRWVL